MSIKIYPKKISGNVHIIGSKSESHRALIASSLSEGKSFPSFQRKTQNGDSFRIMFPNNTFRIEGSGEIRMDTE